jgi:hypothetical protein
MKRLGETRIQRFSRTNKPPVYSSEHMEYFASLGDMEDVDVLEYVKEKEEKQGY